MAKERKIIRVTLHYEDFDTETKEISSNNSSVTYEVYNNLQDLENSQHLTSLYFGDNSIQNILADYYGNSDMDVTVGTNSYMLGKTVNMNLTGTPQDYKITQDFPITPQLIRAFWEQHRTRIPVLTKCASSRSVCIPTVSAGVDFK